MTKDTTELLRDQYESMRTRVQHLRVQADLGQREFEDRLEQLGTALQAGYEQSKRPLAELAETGAEESQRVAQSLQAGWNELLDTYRGLGRERAPRDP